MSDPNPINRGASPEDRDREAMAPGQAFRTDVPFGLASDARSSGPGHFDPDERPPDIDAAELEAAEWFFRREQGLTASDEDDFGVWLKSDPRHAILYSKLDWTWARLADAPREKFPDSQRRFRAAVWVFALAAAAAVALGFFVRTRPVQVAAPITAAGIQTMNLPDGSVITFDCQAKVAVDFTPARRAVTLSAGEASFAVAKEADRPFVVFAAGVRVRAVGTTFHVRLGDREVAVLVTEGRVRVDDRDGRSLLKENTGTASTTRPASAASVPGSVGPDLLSAGQRVVIPLAERVPAPAAVAEAPPDEFARVTAWQARSLYFGNDTLADVISQFNRYNAHQLVIADPALASMRFGGKFPADDYRSLVQLLETNFGVKAEQAGDRTILRLAR